MSEFVRTGPDTSLVSDGPSRVMDTYGTVFDLNPSLLGVGSLVAGYNDGEWGLYTDFVEMPWLFYTAHQKRLRTADQAEVLTRLLVAAGVTGVPEQAVRWAAGPHEWSEVLILAETMGVVRLVDDPHLPGSWRWALPVGHPGLEEIIP